MRRSGTNSHYAACLRFRELRQNGRNKWQEILDGVARRDKNEHEEARVRKVLLEFEILVGGEEDFNPGFHRSLEKLAVGRARPSLLLNRSDLVTWQLASQLPWELLVKQQAHEPLARHAPPRAPPRPVRE